jgi:hypothetical protein
MRKVIVTFVLTPIVMTVCAAFSAQQAFAIKPFNDVFKKMYVEESKNEEFKALVNDKAKCNLCHVQGENKKVRNPYGEASLKAGLVKKVYEPMLKAEKEKAEKEIMAILEKVEAMTPEGGKETFGERIKAGKLPGGNTDGKPEKIILTSAPFVDKGTDGFTQMFDGKTLAGWKINENETSWEVVDGTIVCKGDRSHLFFVGDGKPYKNFHFKAEVKTEKNSNAGIYFHTKFQESGWPKYGFECQVNNSYVSDPRKTSSLYGVKDVLEPAGKDGVWYTQEIIVQGKKVTLKVDGKVIVEYDEPAGQQAGKDFTRVLDEGTFALQAHDPGSRVAFKNLQVKRLD